MRTKGWTITYYVSTILLSLFIVPGSIFDIMQVPEAVEVMNRLQYPAYLLLIVGYAKILGIIGIWQTKWHFLREWAYAGLVIDLFGAFLSHLIVGDGMAYASGPLIGLVITLVSYVSFRKTVK